MSLLHLNPTSQTPPDGFRFVHSETGYRSYGIDWHGFWSELTNYRRLNELSPVTREMVEDQMCKTLPPGWCSYPDGSLPASYIETRVDAGDVLNATKMFAAFVASGMALVPQEVAEERAAICAACPANVRLTGCGACVGFAEVVAAVVGAAKTRADEHLVNRSCSWCKCSSKAQVHVTIEVLAKGVSDQMLSENPFDFCWKKNGIRQLRGS